MDRAKSVSCVFLEGIDSQETVTKRLKFIFLICRSQEVQAINSKVMTVKFIQTICLQITYRDMTNIQPQINFMWCHNDQYYLSTINYLSVDISSSITLLDVNQSFKNNNSIN